MQAYPLEKATSINARGGDVLFFSYCTLHGSLPNRSANTRETVLVQMYSGSDRILENKQVTHVNEQLVLSGWNHHMNRFPGGERVAVRSPLGLPGRPPRAS